MTLATSVWASKQLDARTLTNTQSSSDDQTATDSPVADSQAVDAQTLTELNDDKQDVNQADPLEKFNRSMFTFNNKLDIYFLKPITTLYNKIIPKPLNQGIHNVFTNIGNLPTIANDILQLHFYQMANDLWRLAINTTIGIGGLFDVAARMGLPPYSNDFGLTMAHYGWKQSTYIVFPFWGAYTIRDGIGDPVDYFSFKIYPYINPPIRRYGVYGLSVVDRRAQLLQFQPLYEEAALDKYVFIRNAYLQRRCHQIEQNVRRHLILRTEEEDEGI